MAAQFLRRQPDLIATPIARCLIPLLPNSSALCTTFTFCGMSPVDRAKRSALVPNRPADPETARGLMSRRQAYALNGNRLVTLSPLMTVISEKNRRLARFFDSTNDRRADRCMSRLNGLDFCCRKSRDKPCYRLFHACFAHCCAESNFGLHGPTAI
jgi:hypothetical protein